MISSLAEELGRNRSAVTRDVTKLAEFGLVRVRRENNPGHGIVQMVEAVADKLVMRAAISFGASECRLRLETRRNFRNADDPTKTRKGR